MPRAIQPLVSWDLVRGWMDSCDRNYENCSRHGSLIPLPPRMLLIDVEAQNLVDAPHRVAYIALSYVWGTNQAAGLASCKRATINSLRQAGSLSSLILPAVITDAMEICRKLGERYLWVDWLCIIQDDDEFKLEQIDSMAAIYQKATLVVIAANARSMDDHIAGVGVARNPVDFACSVGDLFVANILWGLPNAVHATFWRTRGWTYQEAVCAKRRLFLTDNQAYFECGIDTRSENLTPFFSADRDVPQQYRLGSGRGEVAYGVSGNADAFHSYASHLRNYLSRDLTFSSDVFSGFLGVSRAIYGKDETFFHGLPQSHFSEGLLWVSGQENGKLAKSRCVANLRVPSWTWASATCPVRHLLSEEFSISSSMFAGPLCAWIAIEWEFSIRKMKVIELYKDSQRWGLSHDGAITMSESTENNDQRRPGTSSSLGFKLKFHYPDYFDAIEHHVTHAWNAGCFEKAYSSREYLRSCDLVVGWPSYYEFWRTVIAAKVYKAIASPRLIVPADATLYTRAQSAFFKLHEHTCRIAGQEKVCERMWALEVLDDHQKVIGFLEMGTSDILTELHSSLESGTDMWELISISLGGMYGISKGCIGRQPRRRPHQLDPGLDRATLGMWSRFTSGRPYEKGFWTVVHVMLIVREGGTARRLAIGWVILAEWAKASRQFCDVFLQ